jgi:endogenous inhibitor of DNA gyrase (YacG/DUF329 family)
MSEPKEVYCPKCGKKVGTYDGKASMNLVCRCNECRKKVVYDIKTGQTRVKPLPRRSTSSGVVF